MISTGDIGGFSGIKVTCVGRSYGTHPLGIVSADGFNSVLGSAQLNYITSVASQLLAGVILTGFTFNAPITVKIRAHCGNSTNTLGWITITWAVEKDQLSFTYAGAVAGRR
ncbi:hypothetical protein FRB93_004299 [Tulasnella sp. JGI-2019a]|nr:hypothetical protein FRB93_004299 [Tulasnella sp. JGI-2019a]